jgi:uncharacterized protein (DUF1330 family)
MLLYEGFTSHGGSDMKSNYKVAVAMLAGVALGALGVQGLHAQAKPPLYVVSEIDVSNLDAYLKEYVPVAQAALKAGGGRILAAGQNITPIEGTPPKSRVTILQWESIEQLNAYRKSAAFVDARKIGDKYAKFRTFAIEGMPQ